MVGFTHRWGSLVVCDVSCHLAFMAKGIGLGFMAKLQPLQPRRQQRQQNNHLDAMVRSSLGIT